jgi:mono/diheme cytochrome c family protein
MAQRGLLIGVIAVTILGAMSTTVPAQTGVSVARGKDLAERSCAGCHAITGNESRTIQGRLVPSLSSIAGGPNATTERLKAIISIPRHPMPATSLALSDINDLAAYIRSLQ